MELIHGVFLAVVLGHVATVNGLYDRNSDVVELTVGNFQGKVLDSDDLWLVEFYAPWCGHCKSLAPEWSKAAAALKGVVKVGAVNMDDHGSVGQPYGIRGFPSIKVFGADKKKPVDYESARTASAIVTEALNQVKKLVNVRLSGGGGSRSSGGSRSGGGGGDGFAAEEVVALTDSNFEQLVLDSDDMWLVAFHAPWCGHCKSLAPHWATAAHELKGKVKLGAVDATADTVYSSRYGVKGFPTIKLFNQGKKDGDAQEYDGGRTSSDIVSWALDKLSAKIEPPEIIQVTEKTTLETACQKNPLCIVSILPHILDCQSDCRNGYLKVLRELGARYKKQLWGWVWAEAGAQPDLEEALGIGGFGYPAMAALNARKMKFALLRGAFSDAGIHEFLRELSVGRGSTAPLRGAELPRVAATTPWDGKDGEMPAEDEYDLSDVELEPLDKDEL